jgi:hypothetical protein
MTIKSKSLGAIALLGSMLAGFPALAYSPNNGAPRLHGKEDAVQDTYSGSEGTVTPPPTAPAESSKAEEVPTMIQRERGNLNK